MAQDELDPLPRHQLRASDADREAAARLLQEAAADGRLGLDELDERLTAAYEAKTYGDLDPVVRDLASAPPGQALAPRPTAAHGSPDTDVLELFAEVDNVTREGAWHVPPRIVAKAGMGTVKLDFTEAVLATDVVHVEASAPMGSVVLLVPEGWRVDMDGVHHSWGSVKNRAVAPRPGTPLLRVTGKASMGDVVVRHPRASRWLPR